MKLREKDLIEKSYIHDTLDTAADRIDKLLNYSEAIKHYLERAKAEAKKENGERALYNYFIRQARNYEELLKRNLK